jgi:hypothetical protein
MTPTSTEATTIIVTIPPSETPPEG